MAPPANTNIDTSPGGHTNYQEVARNEMAAAHDGRMPNEPPVGGYEHAGPPTVVNNGGGDFDLKAFASKWGPALGIGGLAALIGYLALRKRNKKTDESEAGPASYLGAAALAAAGGYAGYKFGPKIIEGLGNAAGWARGKMGSDKQAFVGSVIDSSAGAAQPSDRFAGVGGSIGAAVPKLPIK
jgi:hypothetical protein